MSPTVSGTCSSCRGIPRLYSCCTLWTTTGMSRTAVSKPSFATNLCTALARSRPRTSSSATTTSLPASPTWRLHRSQRYPLCLPPRSLLSQHCPLCLPPRSLLSQPHPHCLPPRLLLSQPHFHRLPPRLLLSQHRPHRLPPRLLLSQPHLHRLPPHSLLSQPYLHRLPPHSLLSQPHFHRLPPRLLLSLRRQHPGSRTTYRQRRPRRLPPLTPPCQRFLIFHCPGLRRLGRLPFNRRETLSRPHPRGQLPRRLQHRRSRYNLRLFPRQPWKSKSRRPRLPRCLWMTIRGPVGWGGL